MNNRGSTLITAVGYMMLGLMIVVGMISLAQVSFKGAVRVERQSQARLTSTSLTYIFVDAMVQETELGVLVLDKMRVNEGVVVSITEDVRFSEQVNMGDVSVQGRYTVEGLGDVLGFFEVWVTASVLGETFTQVVRLDEFEIPSLDAGTEDMFLYDTLTVPSWFNFEHGGQQLGTVAVSANLGGLSSDGWFTTHSGNWDIGWDAHSIVYFPRNIRVGSSTRFRPGNAGSSNVGYLVIFIGSDRHPGVQFKFDSGAVLDPGDNLKSLYFVLGPGAALDFGQASNPRPDTLDIYVLHQDVERPGEILGSNMKIVNPNLASFDISDEIRFTSVPTIVNYSNLVAPNIVPEVDAPFGVFQRIYSSNMYEVLTPDPRIWHVGNFGSVLNNWCAISQETVPFLTVDRVTSSLTSGWPPETDWERVHNGYLFKVKTTSSMGSVEVECRVSFTSVNRSGL